MNIKKLGYDFDRIIKEYKDAFNLVSLLKKECEVLLFGGAVREYMDSEFNKLPRDFDLVVKKKDKNIELDELLSKFEFKKNRFDGYKIIVNSLEFDIWEIEKTWAFREEKIKSNYDSYEINLQNTVFLNIDSIVYNLNTENYYDEKYELAMNTKELDIVLEENPYIELNLLRAILFKRKYSMKFSARLKNILNKFVHSNNNYLDIMEELQKSHYNSIKINKNELKNEINSIIYS